jgi:hypothetical protein
MNIFAGAASNSSQPVSKTYVTAAQQIDVTCGPSWIAATIKTSAAPAKLVDSITALSGLMVLFVIIIL